MADWILENHEERIDKLEAALAAERERHTAFVHEVRDREVRQLRWGISGLIGITGALLVFLFDLARKKWGF